MPLCVFLARTETTSLLFPGCEKKVKVKVHPCTGRTAHRGSGGTALVFLNHGTGRG